ncbi:HAD family acid phosphatase [Rubrivirga litoralis]|uniref:HAD family acid phosphatase n=1 Tax=Rubrivirga litoralis TaxID=3075598 RepID=A0ABU3BMZ6_9BACT|nr:HAD family acid phosphatase [Rubrivirga sp. F394]MDT0630590.1 HAD family acid phosphatase [Rubrivirga sp. F394]
MLGLTLAAALAGCATTAPPEAPASAAVAEAEAPLAVRWARRSAEHDALFLQTYRAAAEHLRAAADTVAGDWGVILDADETILDNSLYQQERAAAGLDYTPESWNAWVRREAAPALLGAVAFTDEVRALGGRVVVVTNRDEAVCPETRANLAAVGVVAAAVLCRTDEGDKTARFEAVERGGADGLPALRVVMWIGDNIQDFPGLGQDARLAGGAGLGAVGGRYWVLPNPMYGSWTGNAE